MKAKMKPHKLLSMLLALVMVVGLLPMGQVAYAEGTTIDKVYLTYDASKVNLNTAYTEGVVDSQVLSNISSATTGVRVDKQNSGLRYLDEHTNIYGIGDGTGQITEGRTYIVRYNLKVASGYDWADKSDSPAIKFYLNGTETTPYAIEYNSSWNSYKVSFTLGTPSTEPIVNRVSIDQSDVSVQVGNSFSFTATVAGNVADKTVTWSVSGAASSDTKISNEGVLSVGSDETATTVTVTATSKADSSKSASRTVTITATPLTIDGVTVSPSSKELYTGDTCSFTVTVTGTENDKSVTWSVTGQTSASTAITSDGKLTVGKDEAAENITVKAVSNADTAKYGEASITIKQIVIIDKVSLTYDASKVNLNTAYTEGVVDSQVLSNISSATTGVRVDKQNSGLRYLDEHTNIYGIGDGTGQITEGRTYIVRYNLKVASGYDWADKSDSPAIKFYLNGTETTPYAIEYNSFGNSYKVSFTLGTPSTEPHTHTFDQETIKTAALKTPAGCTNNAVYFKSCSCGAISTTDTFVAMNTALGHADGSDWKHDSTNHWHECSRCHDKKDEAAHTASDWIIDTPATATTAGTKHKECTVCHRVLETQTIPSTGTIEYNITVTDGKATIGAGSEISKAAEGTIVTLTANAAPSGKVFDEWEVVSGGITLADVNSATTTFTMPAGAVSVKATYKDKPISGGGGGGGGGAAPATPQKPEIKPVTGGKVNLSTDGTTATITPDAGKVVDKVLVNGKDMGAVTELKGLKTGDKIEVLFKDEVKEPSKAETDKQVKANMQKLAPKARSLKTKAGNVKVSFEGQFKDIEALGYTVKYKFYRSTKKASGYKHMLTTSKPSYTNTGGKKGTLYYYKAIALAYDKDGKLIAKSALKQCKYASRRWTK